MDGSRVSLADGLTQEIDGAIDTAPCVIAQDVEVDHLVALPRDLLAQR
jgi:hypothetical protein